jgi:hypothetical protein
LRSVAEKAEEADMYRFEFIFSTQTFVPEEQMQTVSGRCHRRRADMFSHLVDFGSEAVVVEDERSSRCSMKAWIVF